MRFMVMVKATKESETGILPKPEAFAAMQKYNEGAAKAGVLHALLDSYKSWRGSRTDPPQIAILDWREVPTFSEFVLFYDYFKSFGIEARNVIEERAPFRDRPTGYPRLGIVEVTGVPAIGRNLRDEVVTAQQRLPQLFRRVDPSWKTASHPDRGNRSDKSAAVRARRNCRIRARQGRIPDLD